MLVESALVMMLLVTILFGIIEWGMVFKNSLSVTSATRAGARTASSQPRQTNYAQNTAAAVATALGPLESQAPQVLWIYRADGNGLPDSGSFTSNCNVCLRYTWSPASRTWTNAYSNWTGSSQTACGGTNSDAIGVYVRATHRHITGLFGAQRTLADHSVMRLEPVTGQCQP